MRTAFKKVLITGISSYLGSKIARILISNNVSVAGIIRKNSNLALLEDVKDKIKFYNYDGTLESLSSCFKHRYDVVIHLAASTSFNHDFTNLDKIIDSNIRFGVHILEYLRKTSDTLFINTSTYWTHQNKEYSPVNLYAATKQAFIDILIFYNDAFNVPSLTLVLYDVYGLDDTRNKLINCLLNAFGAQKEINLTKGEQELDLVYIDDVVRGYITAANYYLTKKKRRHEIYSLSTGRPIKLKEIVSKLEKAFGIYNLAHLGAIPYRERQIFKIHYKYKKLPYWQPKTDLDKILNSVLRER